MTDRRLTILAVGAWEASGALSSKKPFAWGMQCEHSCATRPKHVSFLVEPKQ